MTTATLRRVDGLAIAKQRCNAVDDDALRVARAIVERVRCDGEPALRALAERFGERENGDALVLDRSAIERGADCAPADVVALLRRAASRIGAFAVQQRDAIVEVRASYPWGQAGHTIEPVASAGCYAPGGRFPLVSSALMTAIPARIAGVDRVALASPNPSAAMLAAALVADVDEVLCVGGAHAVAALAYGCAGLAPCDIVVGPGNRFVTAAKHVVSRDVGVDMLAGPSELLILADDSAESSIIAADLLAQAEHDPEATPMLITTSAEQATHVEAQLEAQGATLPTWTTARAALANGWCAIAGDLDEAIAWANATAAEHVQVMTRDAAGVARRVKHAGAVFIGGASAVALGDYGAGPNHTLPTGGAARFAAGLSIATFLRLRTWMSVEQGDEASALARDAAALARLEGLEAHARAVERRIVAGTC